MTAELGPALVAGLLAGYGIAVPIGAVGAYLVQLSARARWRTGAAAALGVATTDGIYAVVAVLGGTAAADLLAPALPVLRRVSAAVLVLLAARTVLVGLRTSADTSAPVTPAAPGRTFLTLLGLTAVNPTTVVYFAALVVGLPAVTAGPAALAFAVAAFAASASWQLLVAGSGMVLGRVAAAPRGRRITALTSGAVMLVLAVHVGWGGA